MKDEGHTNVQYCTKQRLWNIIIFVHKCAHTLCRNIWISILSCPHYRLNIFAHAYICICSQNLKYFGYIMPVTNLLIKDEQTPPRNYCFTTFVSFCITIQGMDSLTHQRKEYYACWIWLHPYLPFEIEQTKLPCDTERRKTKKWLRQGLLQLGRRGLYRWPAMVGILYKMMLLFMRPQYLFSVVYPRRSYG